MSKILTVLEHSIIKVDKNRDLQNQIISFADRDYLLSINFKNQSQKDFDVAVFQLNKIL
jgi:hypothetical protein